MFVFACLLRKDFVFLSNFVNLSWTIIIFQCFTLEMTQIFEVITQNEADIFSGPLRKNQKQSIKAKMKKFFLTKNLSCYEENKSLFVLLQAESFCNPELISTDIFGLLQITVGSNNVYFKLSLLDCESIQIKAVSTYQKTAVSKLCNMFSSRSDSLTMACHPLTGRIKFTINFYGTQPNQIAEIIERALKIIQDQRDIIDQILQFLEFIPPSMSKFMQKISAKMQKCRYFLLGPHEHCIHSIQKDLHQEYFIEPLTEFQIVHCWLWQNQNKHFLNSVIQRLKSSFLFRPLIIKKTNCLNIRLSQQEQGITNVLESIVASATKNSVQKSKPVVLNCKLLNQQIIPLEFTLKKEPSCRREMQKIQKISKLVYSTFLKQYIVINNHTYANTNFIVCKHENLTPMAKFLVKYRPCLSFTTRLNLCQQLIGLGYLSLTQFKKFTPMCNLDNIQVTTDLKIKLKSVNLDSIVPISIQIAESCYSILYDARCSSHKIVFQNHEYKIIKKKHAIKIIDDGQSKFEGPSIINFWLKKILLDVIDNKNRCYRFIPRKLQIDHFDDENVSSINTDECSEMDVSQNLPSIHRQIQSLEQILFVVSIAFRTFSEIYGDRWEDTIIL